MALKKNILLSGTRHSFALDLARLLSEAGHTVFSAEMTKHHPSAYSNAITKNFVVTKPRVDVDQYIEDLVTIIRRHHIDLFIPLFEEILFISEYKDRFPKHCTLFFPSFDVLDSLNNKWLFNQKMSSYGILSPRSYLLNMQEDLNRLEFDVPFILKPCYSRAAQHIYRIKPGTKNLPTLDISSDHPWIAQEMIIGEKYCSYSICHSGKVHAHATYPVTHALDNSSCVSFTSIYHEKIEQWVKNFTAFENYTGQISFDFIEKENGELYSIECNPRATSGIHLFSPHDHLDEAFLGTNENIIRPKEGVSKHLAAGMLLVMALKRHRQKPFLHILKNFMTTRDVIFNLKDPKPFLFQPYLFLSYTYQSFKERKSIANWFIQDSNWDKTHKKK